MIPTVFPAHADFIWFNNNTNRITYASGGVNYLAGSVASNVGCFVQLIWAGPDGTNSPARLTGMGTSSDDVVHAWGWMGQFVFDVDRNGYMVGESFLSDSNGYYYVRCWSAPSPDFSKGYVPILTSNFYNDSYLWSNPGSEPPFFEDEFNFGGTGFSVNKSALVVDTDSDGMPDWWEYRYFDTFSNASASGQSDTDQVQNVDEYLAGTDPTNSASVFSLAKVESGPAGGIVIQWSGVSGRLYTIDRGTNAPSGTNVNFVFTLLTNNLPAVSGLNSYTDNVGSADAFIYRIRTQP